MLAAFWLVLVPGAAGIPYLKNNKDASMGECFLSGYLFLLAAAELFLLPAVFLGLSLNTASGIFGALMVAAGLYGLRFLKEKRKSWMVNWKEGLRKTSPWLLLAVSAILIQVVIVSLYAHMDADDAFYVGTATAATETNTLFSIDPYTGFPYEALPRRYVLSPFPVLLAVFSKLTMGLHPAILAHVVYPVVFLPVVYLVFYTMGKHWFPENRHAQGIFLLFTTVLTWFSGFSVYTSGNFTLVRIWQGKAMLAGLLLPLTFYLGFCIFMEKDRKYSYVLLVMANLASCHVSSMGIMLSPIMIGIFALMGAVKKRSFRPLIMGLACSLPSLILGVVYLFL